MTMNIFTVVWVSWFLSEVLLNRLFRSKTRKEDSPDNHSLKILWGTIFIALTAGITIANLVSAPLIPYDLIRYTGLLLILAGIVLRFIAIRTLGRFFTVDLAIDPEHSLVKKGLYKYIRHPSYTGSLLSFLGMGLSLNSWISTLVIFIPVLFAFIHRIRIEEKLLVEQLGMSYREYKRQTKRLVPWVY